MAMKPISRRDFLKWLAAGAAAAGLSHFGVLNFGGADPVLATGCGYPPPEVPDTCAIAIPDYCNPMEDQDMCPDPNPGTSSDVCVPDMAEHDECIAGPQSDPDICPPVDMPPDICEPESGDPDWLCEVPPGTADTCKTTLDDVDICPDTPPGDGDLCFETGPKASPDECIPAVGESDMCVNTADPDFCRDPITGVVQSDRCNPPDDPDICTGETPDICDPGAGNPDAPNSTSLHRARGASSLLAALGGAAAVLIGATFGKSKEV